MRTSSALASALFASFALAPCSHADGQLVPVAQSVWQIDSGNSATHLESRLACPAALAGYRRQSVETFDMFGLDVGCGYRDDDGEVLALYLTKTSNADTNAALASAEAALKQQVPDAMLAAQSGGSALTSGLSWAHATFEIGQRHERSGLWFAPLSGWMVELSANYQAARGPDVTAAADLIAKQVQASAGPHLMRCAASAVPNRSANALRKEDSGLTVGSVLATAGALDADAATKPAEWCVEGAVDGPIFPVLLWHALNAEGEAIAADRATLATLESVPAVRSTAEPPSGAGNDRFLITLTQGNEVTIFGETNGRPTGKLLSAIMKSLIDGKAKPLATFNRKAPEVEPSMSPKN